MIQCLIAVMKLNWWFAIYSKLTPLRVVHALRRCTVRSKLCQKQVGGKDSGVSSVAFTTAIVLGLNPGKITFLQPVIRAHLVNCLNKGKMIMFPYK